MATASVTVTVDKSKEPDVSERYVEYYGTLAVDASPDTYDATSGLVVSFAGLVNHSQPPVECAAFSTTSGWQYTLKPGATIATCVLRVFGVPQALAGTVGGDPLKEVVNGTAVFATISGDTIYWKAKFRKGQ